VIRGNQRPPASENIIALLKQEILASLKKQGMLRPGDRVGVAVSGGADSVALLLLLLELREKLGTVLSVVHFNHKLRGKASDADEAFVAKLAAKHGLEFHADHRDVAKMASREHINLEDAGRRARYQFFELLADDGLITRVATAHTSDDQAETVLAHILRGTGLAGLGGIRPVAGRVIRPLLEFRRSELRAYLLARKQSWREDASNQDTSRMRARIREKLLPLLEKEFQRAAVEHLTTLARIASEEEAFLQFFVRLRWWKLPSKGTDSLEIPITELLKPWVDAETQKEFPVARGELEKPLTKRLLRQIIESMKPRRGQLSAKDIDEIFELVLHGQSGKSLHLPGGIHAKRGRDKIVFSLADKTTSEKRETQNQEYEYKIDLGSGGGEAKVAELACVFRLRVIDWPPKRGETSRDGAVLDRDRLRIPVVLRNWRSGDRLRPLGHRSAHKLKRLLNEKHVSRWERDGWPVLTSGGVLAWARGFPVAAEFAANEGTRTAIVIVEEKI
jgi:tRNA(Ile)-lysidine synthase